MQLGHTRSIARLASLGMKPLPVNPGEKHPYVEWTRYRDRPSWPALASHFKPGVGAWTPLGSVTGWVVLDLDNDAAVDLWSSRLDPALRPGVAITRKGRHLYFRIPQGEVWPGWTWKSDPEAVELDAHYEVLGDGNGVITPPSHHADDRDFVYSWRVAPEDAPLAPDDLRRPTRLENAPTSMLSHRLRELPQEGGRDVWMAQVAGHLAKWIPYEDAYLSLLHVINEAMPAPLTADEIDKKRGIWHKEREKTKFQFDEDAGWLVGTGRVLMTEARGRGEDADSYPAEWADFDVKLAGTLDVDDHRMYIVDFVHKSGYERRKITLDPRVFSQSSMLTAWLASHGGTIMPVPNDVHGSAPEGRRLFRYIRGQKAPVYTTVSHLGWTDGVGFVSQEGVITSDGIQPHGDVIPDPILGNWVTYQYGEIDERQAIDTLREVLTFQDPIVTSVFASWWVMAILKGQYPTSLFPFMALEAPSESGKTRGFFAMMVAMAGNATGHGQFTSPVMRDMTAAHRNGIVWLDDVTDIAGTIDIVRQATSEGSRAKKGQDRTRNEETKLLSPIMISGEGMGQVMSEKAMRDRAVRLKVTSPIGRMSPRDPNRAQWDDVLATYAQYDGDLTRVAGSLVRLVLGHATLLSDLPGLRVGSGRHADKMALIRMGARILSAITEDDSHITRVDEWALAVDDEGAVNFAILEIIPWSLRSRLMPRSAKGHQPAFVDHNDIVWVAPERLADEWRNQRNTGRGAQLGTERAIRDELEANGSVGSSRHVVEDARASGGSQTRRRYVALTAHVSRIVLGRAGVESDEDAHEDSEHVSSVSS